MKILGTMNIFKHEGSDCSNYGISSKCDEVIIVDEFDPNAPFNAVVIIEDIVCQQPRIRAVPANSFGKWTMFGGCAIYTSNGIVPHSGVWIPLHDRIES